MLNRLEPAVQRTFGLWGAFLSIRHRLVLTATLVALAVVCSGVFKLQSEDDAIELWVADRGRIHQEMDYYRDEFSQLSPNLESFIVTPAVSGGNLFSVEALAEVEALQKWIMQYRYKHSLEDGRTMDVMLEDICFKPVDKEDHEPCFQYSILDCFQEGNVFTPGGKKNSVYSGIYFPAKKSFRTFNFPEEFTVEFVRDSCVQWYNQGTSDTMTLGGITKGINSVGDSTIVQAEALRLVFGTKSKEKLAEDGLKRVKWTPKKSSGQSDIEICNNLSDCSDCIDEVGLAQASAAGCEPRSGAQADSCCEFMQLFRDTGCIEQLFEAKPSVGSLANLVFTGCKIPTVQLGESRCRNEDEFIDKTSDLAAPVCICLTDSESEECETAAMAYVSENLETAETFLAAQSGDAAARAELGALLISKVGCVLESGAAPQPEKEGEEEESGDLEEVPEVCVCLTDSTSTECSTAAQAFSLANPEHTAIFTQAASGDEAAKQEIARLLLDDLNCLGGGGRDGGKRKLMDKAAEDIEGLPLVCACIADGDSPNCNKGVVEFLTANPQYSVLFANAAVGNQTAVGEATTVILTEGGCDKRKYSFKTVETALHNEDEAWDILHGWEKGWRSAIKDEVDGYEHIKVSWISSSTLDDETRAATKGQSKLISVGFVLVGLYITAYFAFDMPGGSVKFSTLPPGPFAALLAYLSILLGICATFGIIGFVSLSSLKTSPITLQIVPLLMVGLGVNDFFVLASYLKSTLQQTPGAELSRTMYDAMAGGGSSITLSSITNTVAFALGALSPIPAIQWFSIHMMIGVVVAYLVSMTIIPVILLVALKRYVEGKADFFLPVVGEPKPEEVPHPATLFAGSPSVDNLSSKLGSIIVFVVYGFWLGISIWGISRFDLGLPTSQIVPKGEETYRYLVPAEKYFQSFPINLVYKDVEDCNTLESFEDNREMEYEFVERAYMVDKSQSVASWLNYYSEYVESKFCSNDICMNEVEWYWDDFFSETFGTQDICKGLAGTSECEKACRERCPQGPVGSQYRCELARDKKSCYCPYRPKLKEDVFYENPKGSRIDSYWADFLTNTTGGSISQKLISFDKSSATSRNPYGTPTGFRTITTVEELYNVNDKLKHIESGREIMDSGVVEGAYAFDVAVYGIGEQYRDIGRKAVVAVVISIAVTLVVMMPLIVHWFAAIIVAFCVISAVVLTAGTSHWMGMHLNHSLFVSLVVTVGLSIEFCAHIARHFMLSDGARCERVAHAVKSVGFAVFNGGITTFLGIIPVAWADFNYFKKYFFVLYSVVVVVGLFVGLLVLPALLLWIGPRPSGTNAAANHEDMDQNKRVEMTGTSQ